MKARIEIEIDDRVIEERVQDFNKAVGRGEFDPIPTAEMTAEEYLRERLADVANDELRVALWGWKIETKVIVDG